MPPLVIHRVRDKDIGFPHLDLSRDLHQYFLSGERIPAIFQQILHININFNGYGKVAFFRDGDLPFLGGMPQVGAINEDVEVGSFELEANVVWVEIDEIHSNGRLGEAQFFDGKIFKITVFNRLWCGAR